MGKYNDALELIEQILDNYVPKFQGNGYDKLIKTLSESLSKAEQFDKMVEALQSPPENVDWYFEPPPYEVRQLNPMTWAVIEKPKSDINIEDGSEAVSTVFFQSFDSKETAIYCARTKTAQRIYSQITANILEPYARKHE